MARLVRRATVGLGLGLALAAPGLLLGCAAGLSQLPELPKPAPDVPGTLNGAPRAGRPATEPATGGAVVSPPAAGGSALAAPSAGGAEGVLTVVSFPRPTVVLYSGEFSHDGERVAVGSLPLPLPARDGASSSGRVQIMTVSGPRWLSRTEIGLASGAATTPSPRQ